MSTRQHLDVATEKFALTKKLCGKNNEAKPAFSGRSGAKLRLVETDENTRPIYFFKSIFILALVSYGLEWTKNYVMSVISIVRYWTSRDLFSFIDKESISLNRW